MKQLLFIAILLGSITASAQEEVMHLTLPQAIEMAQAHSPEAEAARHTYRAAYWNHRFYRANYLPSVTLTSSPYFNKQISKVTQPDGTNLFIKQNQLSVDMDLKINQNIWFTGGSLFVKSNVQRLDELETDVTAYNSQPIVIGYEQALFGYNSLKWDRRIEPVRFREARKAYNEALELVASQTSNLFFNLATAQTNLDIASSNYASADTLYRYAEGRYNIGTITENEMLQLEINKLTEETNMMNARIEVEDQMQVLRSFLGFQRDVTLKVIPEGEVPQFEIPLGEALKMAFENSPEPDMYKRMQLQSQSNLAYAKANAGLKADLYVQFGLSQTGDKFTDSYRNPMNQQYASIGISLPILDWGRGKGQIRVAKSNVDLVNTQAEQGMKDFELNVARMVRQFNLQSQYVKVASKTDRTADRRYEVAKRLYILGKSTILDLNAAITEKDAARRSYISALKSYWSLYYGLRSMTGYDFEKNQKIEENYPEI
ncbi:MAG: TolC family protein [Bacteroidaceae bacterium]|nr:TolC family protein [Bacteroidaceae bacterium]MBR6621761.1 TolC family protein [Bacteroides sp.]